MSDQPYRSGGAVPSDAIPMELEQRVGPNAPERTRKLIARAVLPMPPDQLGVALAILARDPDPEIAADAQKSMLELPGEVIDNIISSDNPGPVLDVYAHAFAADAAKLGRLLSNRSTLDETIIWMAGTLRGTVLDYVAANQVRLVACPEIIGAMIANPAAPTPVLARIVETAIRNQVDTSGVPGFRQLAQAFFSYIAGDAPAEEDESDEAVETPEDLTEEDLEQFTLDGLDSEFGIDDAELEALLTGRVVTDSETGANKPLWKLIDEMSLPQKVRLALMGDATARKILVRDPKKTVATAVLRSPKITDKEIAAISVDKAIDGEIIRMIARTREWTRTYQVQMNLVQNPKCPTQIAIGFIKNLRRRDLAGIARGKHVPANIRRFAKQVMDARGI